MSQSLPSWFSVSVFPYNKGGAAYFNGVKLPLRILEPLDYAVPLSQFIVPSARDWLTLPSGIDLLSNIWYNRGTQHYIVHRSGNSGTGFDPDNIVDSMAGDPEIFSQMTLEEVAKGIGIYYGVDANEYVPFHGGLVTNDGHRRGFLQVQMKFSGADSYRWGHNAEGWRLSLGTVVDWTGNTSLLDTIDFDQVSREYDQLMR